MFTKSVTLPEISDRVQKGLLLNSGQLAKLLNFSRSTIWRLDASGKLPNPVRLGGSTRWRAKEVRAWVEAGCPPREKWNAGFVQTRKGG